MQEKQILDHAKQAVNAMAPDCFDAIWEKASHADAKDYPIPKVTQTSKSRWKVSAFIGTMITIAACIAVILGLSRYQQVTIYSTITLDINPSICICVNRNSEVLSMEGFNSDGEAIINNLKNAKHRKLNEVVTEMITSIADKGYFKDEIENSVLISVDAENTQVAQNFITELSEDISLVMEQRHISGNIISQQLTNVDTKVDKLAEKLHISKGKATLVREISERDKKLSEEALANMKITDLVTTAEAKHLNINKKNIQSKDSGSDITKNTKKPAVTNIPKSSKAPTSTKAPTATPKPEKSDRADKKSNDKKHTHKKNETRKHKNDEEQPQTTSAPEETVAPTSTPEATDDVNDAKPTKRPRPGRDPRPAPHPNPHRPRDGYPY